MTTKKQKAQARREAAERQQAEWLAEHKAWNWQWPGSGSNPGSGSGSDSGSEEDTFDLPRNCWFTNNPRLPEQQYPEVPMSPGVRVFGPQTYYGVSASRARRRKTRRTSKRLHGMRFGRAHDYSRGG